MNKSKLFPICEIKNNLITNHKGEKSFFYSVSPKDLEQFCDSKKENYLDLCINALSSLGSENYYKFYKINNDIYLNTNSRTPIDFPEVEYNSKGDALSILIPSSELYSDILFSEDCISYSGKFLRILSVTDFPVNPNALEVFNDLNYVVCLRKIDKKSSKSRLERKRSSLLSSFIKNKRDISGESAYAQTEELLEEIIHNQEALFNIETFILIYADNLKTLNQETLIIKSELDSLGIKVFCEGQSVKSLRSGFYTIFNEILPGVTPTFKHRSIIDKSSHLIRLLPISKSQLMVDGIRFHDQSGNPIFFNPFSLDYKNRNILVSGNSGSGKSVLVNKLVHSLVEQRHCVILDKGGSFRKLCQFHSGHKLTGSFNPFQFKDPTYLREVLLSLIDENCYTKIEKAMLYSELKELVPKSRSLEEVVQNLSSRFVGLRYVLEEYSSYFKSEFSEIPRILYVDINEFPKEIVSTLIIYILEYFKNLNSDESILVFDECWSFLKSHYEFVDECFRTFRKTGSLPIAISQSLDDFGANNGDLANSIINNSNFHILFPQNSASEQISEFDEFCLSQLVLSKGYFSDFYLKSSDLSIQKIVRTHLSPLEHQLFHTEPGLDYQLNNFLCRFEEVFKDKRDAFIAFTRITHETYNNDFITDFCLSNDKS